MVGSGHSKVSQGSFGPTTDSNVGPSFKPKKVTTRTSRILKVHATFVAKKATSGGTAMPVNDRTTPRLQPESSRCTVSSHHPIILQHSLPFLLCSPNLQVPRMTTRFWPWQRKIPKELRVTVSSQPTGYLCRSRSQKTERREQAISKRRNR